MSTTVIAERVSGKQVTDELRRYFRVGPRTRRHRKSPWGDTHDLHARMIEEIMSRAMYPDASNPRDTIVRAAWGAALSYEKHYLGYRMDLDLRRRIELMSPWAFSALLGRMVDACVTNVGEGERFFQQMATEARRGHAA